MPSISSKTLLILESLKSLLLNDHLDDSWADLLVDAVNEIIEGAYIDLNVLMHCAISICHFRVLLEKDLAKYEGTNVSAAFTLVYTCFKTYVDELSQREERMALTALLDTKSINYYQPAFS